MHWQEEDDEEEEQIDSFINYVVEVLKELELYIPEEDSTVKNFRKFKMSCAIDCFF